MSLPYFQDHKQRDRSVSPIKKEKSQKKLNTPITKSNDVISSSNNNNNNKLLTRSHSQKTNNNNININNNDVKISTKHVRNDLRKDNHQKTSSSTSSTITTPTSPSKPSFSIGGRVSLRDNTQSTLKQAAGKFTDKIRIRPRSHSPMKQINPTDKTKKNRESFGFFEKINRFIGQNNINQLPPQHTNNMSSSTSSIQLNKKRNDQEVSPKRKIEFKENATIIPASHRQQIPEATLERDRKSKQVWI